METKTFGILYVDQLSQLRMETSKKILIAAAALAVILVAAIGIKGAVTPDTGNSGLYSFGSWFSKQPGSFQISNLSMVCTNDLPQVNASWSLSSNAVNYQLQRQSPGSTNWYTTGSGTGTSLTDTSLQAGYQPGSYSYRVRAISKYSSRSTYSNAVVIKIPACQTAQSPAPAPAPVPSPSTTPTSTLPSTTKLWGAYLSDDNVSAFENLVGKKINIQAVFLGTTDPFPSQYKSTLSDQGKTLAIFWEPYDTSLDAIIAGNSDAYFKQFASQAKNYGGPVIFIPFHEMNGNWDPWDGTVGSNTPSKEIAAWKHVHDLFSGVSNVKFGWAVNNDSVPDTSANSIASYYPGDAYVDYVGVDGFNFGNPSQTFSSVFNSALSQLSVYKKPVYIFSMATTEDSQKAAWITDFLKVQLPQHPEIAGWIWFNENKEQNWLVNSDSNALQAFKSGLQQ